jgi:hypothetical protein
VAHVRQVSVSNLGQVSRYTAGLSWGFWLISPVLSGKWGESISLRAVVFNLFCSRTPRHNFSSSLYPQSCWCIIQVTHSL